MCTVRLRPRSRCRAWLEAMGSPYSHCSAEAMQTLLYATCCRLWSKAGHVWVGEYMQSAAAHWQQSRPR